MSLLWLRFALGCYFIGLVYAFVALTRTSDLFSRIALHAASLGMVLACWYFLRLYQGVTQGRLRLPGGQTEADTARMVARLGHVDAGVVELVVLAPLMALIVLIGVYPAPVIRYTRYSADQYVSAVDRGSTAAASASARPELRAGAKP